jgi:hypothetical protein
MGERQTSNKLRRQAFLDGKTNPRKQNIHGLITNSSFIVDFSFED